MRQGAVHDAENEHCLISQVWQTNNALERMRGLLGRPALTQEQGLWIEPCPSVHTIGMRYAIDVVFLDKSGRVKKICDHLKPLRFSSCTGARISLELAAGMAKTMGIRKGMVLYWKE